uniref:Uncharacterized protein n=1 Tax=Chenopodium quinoa TaxID=63459 RepID=A0A803M2H0_CHEQI
MNEVHEPSEAVILTTDHDEHQSWCREAAYDRVEVPVNSEMKDHNHEDSSDIDDTDWDWMEPSKLYAYSFCALFVLRKQDLDGRNEKLKQKTIEQNGIRMKDLGVTSMAYEMKQSMKGSKQTKKRKKVTKDTNEYTPDEEGELNHSSEEDENEIRKTGVNLRSRSKKVVTLRGKITTNIKDTTGVSSIPMANITKMRLQNTEIQHLDQGLQGRDSMQRKIQLGKYTAQKKSAVHNQ